MAEDTLQARMIKSQSDGKQYKVCAVYRDLACDMTPVDAPWVPGVTP